MDFFTRVEELCKVVANSIDDDASPGSIKEKLLKMADEAADFNKELHPNAGMTVGPKKIVVKLAELEEALL